MNRPSPSFEEVYGAFAPRIRRYLGRLAGEQDAPDLTQEVFARVNRALDAFRGESQLSTWVYRIATNVALDRLRKASVDAAGGPRVEEAPVADPAPLAEQEVVRREMGECVREFVEDLPPDYRSVIVMSEFEELTDRQIADVLGVSLEAVKIRLHRARARLRVALEAGCHTYRDERNELACYPADEAEVPDAPSPSPGPDPGR
jgi:RNA polymerase sigma-70 factor, ECF subfamily